MINAVRDTKITRKKLLNMNTLPHNKKALWETPWGYSESFIIGLGLIFTGFLMELMIPTHNALILKFPYNLYAVLGYVAILFIAFKWCSNLQLVRWMTKVPASISSIVLVTVMVMLMGTFPQVPSENKWITALGLNHITTHWSFILILMLFLSCLGLVTIKRVLQFKWKNTGFILNHLGLFLALVAGMVGTGDLQRLTLDTYEGKPSLIAYDIDGKQVELPFAVYLKDFKMEEYLPKLALVDNEEGKIVHNNGKNLYLIEEGITYPFETYEIEVLTFLSSSGRVANGYQFVNEAGSPPSAQIKVTNKQTKEEITGWICSGSFRHPYEALKINDELSVVMTIPEAKKFASDISLLNPDGSREEAVLEVNKPLAYQGYKLYQLSYDDRMGKWSNLSVIELVRDPWLPVIYIGIFMMIIGAVYMFWTGSKINKEEAL